MLSTHFRAGYVSHSGPRHTSTNRRPPNIIIGSSTRKFMDCYRCSTVHLSLRPSVTSSCPYIYRYYLTSTTMRILDTGRKLKKTYPIYDESRPRLPDSDFLRDYVLLHPVHHKDTAGSLFWEHLLRLALRTRTMCRRIATMRVGHSIILCGSLCLGGSVRYHGLARIYWISWPTTFRAKPKINSSRGNHSLMWGQCHFGFLDNEPHNNDLNRIPCPNFFRDVLKTLWHGR
jgi:hypothetical protein